ncbi:hypothetical protein I4U23_015732 [Adineta vaga]|nr:hypothetical protein I4U23_015732 [Adineta vaga]
MGCSASVTPTSTIPSIKKIDVGTNTVSDASLPISRPIDNANKYSNDISTQTDSAQDDLLRDQTLCSKNLQNTDSNLTDSRSNRVSDNQNDFRQRANSNELDIKTYNQINPRFYQDPLDHEELDWILTGMNASQFCINHQSLVAPSTQVTPAMVVDAMEKSDDLAHIAPKVRKLLNKAKSTGDATYLVQAYTVESKFYKILNRNLARQSLGNPTDMDPME